MPKALEPTIPPAGAFGGIIRAERVSQGLTLNDIGYEVGVARQTVQNWEQGRARPRTVLLPVLADLFNLDPEELVEALR